MTKNKKSFMQYIISTEQRVSRSVYWGNFVFIMFVIIGIILLEYLRSEAYVLGGLEYIAMVIFRIGQLIIILFLIVSIINIDVRRWRDLNKSGLWSITNQLPFVNLWALYCCGFQRGTEGPNRYGDDPLEPSKSSSKNNYEETTRDIEETSEIKSSDKEEIASSEEAVSDNEKDSPEGKLTKLSELKEKGLIDEEDYNSKKEEILKTI